MTQNMGLKMLQYCKDRGSTFIVNVAKKIKIKYNYWISVNKKRWNVRLDSCKLKRFWWLYCIRTNYNLRNRKLLPVIYVGEVWKRRLRIFNKLFRNTVVNSGDCKINKISYCPSQYGLCPIIVIKFIFLIKWNIW